MKGGFLQGKAALFWLHSNLLNDLCIYNEPQGACFAFYFLENWLEVHGKHIAIFVFLGKLIVLSAKSKMIQNNQDSLPNYNQIHLSIELAAFRVIGCALQHKLWICPWNSRDALREKNWRKRRVIMEAFHCAFGNCKFAFSHCSYAKQNQRYGY